MFCGSSWNQFCEWLTTGPTELLNSSNGKLNADDPSVCEPCWKACDERGGEPDEPVREITATVEIGDPTVMMSCRMTATETAQLTALHAPAAELVDEAAAALGVAMACPA